MVTSKKPRSKGITRNTELIMKSRNSKSLNLIIFIFMLCCITLLSSCLVAVGPHREHRERHDQREHREQRRPHDQREHRDQGDHRDQRDPHDQRK